MQKYYLKFHTALVILNIASVTSEADLLPHIAKSAVHFSLIHHTQEFEEYPIKQGQKAFLNSVWSKLGKYHYKGKVKETYQKVVSLLMVLLSLLSHHAERSGWDPNRRHVHDVRIRLRTLPSLSPSLQIIQTSTRICRALVFYFSQRPSFPPDVREGDLLLWVLSLLRALQQRTWGDGSRVLLQLVRVTLLLSSSGRRGSHGAAQSQPTRHLRSAQRGRDAHGAGRTERTLRGSSTPSSAVASARRSSGRSKGCAAWSCAWRW